MAKTSLQSPKKGKIRSPLRQAAEARGRHAEALVEQRLAEDGWATLDRRCRTPLGEIDLVAEKDGLLAFVEVKGRARLLEAAHALTARQCARLSAAAEYWCALHPGHGEAGIRFDLLLVDDAGKMRRIADAFRPE
ncbi:YraN family protein [Acetobacteraceae bacterium H6797]|nr:YraN family protein [Acetobacteraceae bacterium H6797]